MTKIEDFRSKFTGKSVLVTGGAGFVGSNLARTLVGLGAKVRVVDNLITGHKSNIEDLIDSGLEFIEGDIRDYSTCLSVLEGVDMISHQAALGSVPRSIIDPIASHDHNVNGTLNIMRAAVEKEVHRVVFASSSSVYGDESTLPKVEHKTGRILSPYAATKCIDEVYGDMMNAVYGLDVVGLRYFNIYGPRQDPNGPYAAVIPKFIELLADGKTPTIYGDGEQSRDFTYIENAVQANLSAMSRVQDFGFEVMNIACGSRLTINDLFFRLRESLSHFIPEVSQIEVIHGEEREGDILHSHADITKASRLLNYEVLVDVEEGIKGTVDWFMNAKI
jgi:UDP-N-acetylglucosamine 4-epimerase